MRSSSQSELVPPRLLTGVTLLYWGAMTGESIIALLIAVLLEGKNWVKWSWDFDAAAYVKAFQVSLGLLGLVLLLVWLDEVNHNSLFQVMKWFPVCFLPVELAQRYGQSDSMNLNTFFYFSRQRMRQDLKEGRSVSPKRINTGYPYLFIVLIVASCSNKMNSYVHIVMLVLVAMVIVAVSVKRGMGWKRLIWALPMVLLLSVWLQLEASSIYKSYAMNSRGYRDPGEGESTPYRSFLGQLGDIKQSPAIQWRMWGDEVPEYLRLNVYNKHHGVMWSYDYKSAEEGFDDMEGAFDSRLGVPVVDEKLGLYVFEGEHKEVMKVSNEGRKKVRLRGMGQSDTEESIVPSVGGLLAIGEMGGEDVKAAVHPLGVLKLIKRKATIDYSLWLTDQNRLDLEPAEGVDLAIHKSCKEAVERLSDEMGLSGVRSEVGKVSAIRDYFMSEFTYALHFDVPKTDYGGSDIVRFMGKQGRKGHCEYFATTAALLLRGQGIPTRYCVGYVVREKDDGVWVMRGSHAHAWCSAWIDGKWEIVDLTPPDWLSLESEQVAFSWTQGFKDWFQSVKEDFSIWRNDEENRAFLNMTMWVVGGALLVWVGYRLFKVRVRKVGNDEYLDNVLGYQLPQEFEFLEAKLTPIIGGRGVAQTYYSWVNGAEGLLDKSVLAKLRDLVSCHEESRFGGVDKSLEIEEISQHVKRLLN